MNTRRTGLTPFQVRRINDLTAEANERAAAFGAKNLFSAVGSDGQTLLAPGQGHTSDKDPLYRTILEQLRPQMMLITEGKSPMAEDAQRIVAALLWDIPGVFRYRDSNHFKLKNTTHSPVYFNCREVPKWAFAMNLICSLFQQEYETTCEPVDVFVGGEVAGIPFATWWAEMSHGSLVIARKPKAHGIPSALDGRIFENDWAILVEDLINDGGSKGIFLDGIENAGGTVEDVFVLFDREQGGAEYLAGRGKRLHALVTRTAFLRRGLELKRIDDAAMRDMEEYFANPERWNRGYGYEWNPVGAEG